MRLNLIEEELFKENAYKGLVVLSDLFEELRVRVRHTVELCAFFAVDEVFSQVQETLLVNALNELSNACSGLIVHILEHSLLYVQLVQIGKGVLRNQHHVLYVVNLVISHKLTRLIYQLLPGI